MATITIPITSLVPKTNADNDAFVAWGDTLCDGSTAATFNRFETISFGPAGAPSTGFPMLDSTSLRTGVSDPTLWWWTWNSTSRVVTVKNIADTHGKKIVDVKFTIPSGWSFKGRGWGFENEPKATCGQSGNDTSGNLSDYPDIKPQAVSGQSLTLQDTLQSTDHFAFGFYLLLSAGDSVPDVEKTDKDDMEVPEGTLFAIDPTIYNRPDTT